MNLLVHSIPTWIQLASLALCFGALLCSLWVLAPATSGDTSGRNRIFARLWRYFGIGVALIALCSAADLVSRTAEMSGRSISTALPLLPAVIMHTHFGAVWLIRMAGLVLSVVIMLIGRNYRGERWLLRSLFVIFLVIAFTESATGHAADSGDFTVAEFADLIHLVACTAWAGGVAVLALIVLPANASSDSRGVRHTAAALPRFSRIAGTVVGALVATSLYNAWKYIGSAGGLVGSSYGQLVIAKGLLFTVVLGFAAYHRYFNVPQLQALAGQTPLKEGVPGRIVAKLFHPLTRRMNKERMHAHFARTMMIETGLMLAILLCVAMLRHDIPARHFSHHHLLEEESGHEHHEHEGHILGH
jgi:putative copper export protein